MTNISRNCLLLFTIIIQITLCVCKEKENEIFETEFGDVIKIGLSDKGYKSVELKCGSNSMLVNLITDNDFDGVIYTRGSFYNKDSNCFFDSSQNKNENAFSIKFSLDECNTKKEGEVYSNVLVLQHDKELIMPGDTAFKLECDFNKPRDITVSANLQNENQVVSRISLTFADPGLENADSTSKNKRSIENASNTVILTQDFFRNRIIDEKGKIKSNHY